MFDIHPPLGKLTLYVVARMFGYEHIEFSFNSIGQNFGDLLFYPQRAFAAICGSLIPPVMYLTCRSLSLSTIASLCTAAMPLLDFLLCVESRLILTDSQLILYLQAAYLFSFLLWQTPRSTPRRYMLLVATAVFAACALSTKYVLAPIITYLHNSPFILARHIITNHSSSLSTFHENKIYKTLVCKDGLHSSHR